MTNMRLAADEYLGRSFDNSLDLALDLFLKRQKIMSKLFYLYLDKSTERRENP